MRWPESFAPGGGIVRVVVRRGSSIRSMPAISGSSGMIKTSPIVGAVQSAFAYYAKVEFVCSSKLKRVETAVRWAPTKVASADASQGDL